MNKLQIYFFKSQVILIMVYKILFRIIIFFCISIMPVKVFSNVIYDKNSIIITNIDLNYYKQLYLENFGEKLNDSIAIKNIVLIKKVIDKFEKKNPEFLKRIDEVLIEEYGKDRLDVQIVKDFIRYFRIKNEFIYEFYDTQFNINDLKIIFNSFEKIDLPISNNNCLTLLEIIDFKDNTFFLNSFYDNLKKETKKYEVIINNLEYEVCIDSRTYKYFENKILNYIDLKTREDFKKFTYE